MRNVYSGLVGGNFYLQPLPSVRTHIRYKQFYKTAKLVSPLFYFYSIAKITRPLSVREVGILSGTVGVFGGFKKTVHAARVVFKTLLRLIFFSKRFYKLTDFGKFFFPKASAKKKLNSRSSKKLTVFRSRGGFRVRSRSQFCLFFWRRWF